MSEITGTLIVNGYAERLSDSRLIAGGIRFHAWFPASVFMGIRQPYQATIVSRGVTVAHGEVTLPADLIRKLDALDRVSLTLDLLFTGDFTAGPTDLIARAR